MREVWHTAISFLYVPLNQQDKQHTNLVSHISIEMSRTFFRKLKDFLIHKNEPLRRGRGKPHIAEFLYRHGGETVYVSRQYPNGLTESEYKDLIIRNPGAKNFAWRTMRRNATVIVKGRISHPDHATIILDDWHEVVTNTESESIAFRDVAFLD